MARDNKAEVAAKLPLPASDHDESAFIKQVLLTHSSDCCEVDFKKLKTIDQVIRGILHEADQIMESVISGKSKSGYAYVGKTPGEASTLKDYASSINKISWELSCRCSGGADSYSAATFAILNNLSKYFWDAKVVISLAAFAVNYVEFCLIAQLNTTNPLAMVVSPLRFPCITEPSCIVTIKDLLNAILNVTKWILKFKELISQEILAKHMADDISVAAYWTIQSMVICSSIITDVRIIFIPKELQRCVAELTKIEKNFNSKLQEIRYQDLIRKFGMPDADTITIIRPLICIEGDKSQQPFLYATSNRIGFEKLLKAKTLVFLISDLDIVKEELFALVQSHNEKKKESDLSYEIIWIPLVDISTPSDKESREKKFKTKMEELNMPWHIVADPWSLDPVLIRYVKEKWNFSKNLNLVVMDTKGKVVCENAFNMFRIWGNVAYPFTTAKEKSLWKEETWKLELLVKSFDQRIAELMSKGKFICLYGGSDTEWIAKFIAEAQRVAKTAGITLEMVYAGTKRKAKEQEIKAGNIPGTILQHQTHFWTRLECMWNSRVQHIDDKTTKDDSILQEVSKMLSFGKSKKGWAVIGERSSTEMAIANGNIFLQVLQNLKLSAVEIDKKNLVRALKKDINVWYDQQIQQKHPHSHCNKIMISWEGAKIAEKWLCADCGRPMEMYFMYRCCTD